MPSPVELQTMAVRLTGDGTLYHKMLTSAERQTVKTTRTITQRFANMAQRTGDSLKSMGARMTGLGAAMSLAVAAPVIGMVKSFASFDDAMTKSTSIMGNMTADMRKQMEETAIAISLNSTTSARAAAEAYFFLASAGLSAKASIAALPVVEKFAVAGAFDMALATDLLTDAQSALGLTVKDSAQNMKNMSYVSDILVKANTLANASVQQFSEALTNEAGAAMRAYNVDLEEGMALLASYADQGTKANVGGSMMGRMFRLVIQSANANGEAFRKLGIDTTEFMATGKGMTGIVEGITKAVDGMGPGMKAATLESLGFEARIQQAIMPLLGATDAVRGYEKELRKAGGTTQDVANKQLTSFSAQMTILWNRITAVGQSIGSTLAPFIMRMGESLSTLLKWYNGLLNSCLKT